MLPVANVATQAIEVSQPERNISRHEKSKSRKNPAIQVAASNHSRVKSISHTRHIAEKSLVLGWREDRNPEVLPPGNWGSIFLRFSTHSVTFYYFKEPTLKPSLQ